MKQITINLYSIDELGKKAQENAFAQYRHFNVENNDWYDCQFDDFVNLCKTIGITVSAKDIWFSGFWSQGDGSAFESIIDVIPFVNAIKQKAWKDYAPRADFDFTPCPCNEKVLSLISKGYIECELWTKKPKRGYSIEFWSDFHFIHYRKTIPANINHELTKLHRWVEHCVKLLNGYLYKSLEEQYEYETSDGALKGTFKAKKFLFTQDGKMANRLLRLDDVKLNSMNVEITDLNGQKIGISDLDAAVELAGQYKWYERKGKRHNRFDKKQQAYWRDMYDKLFARKLLNDTLKF